MASFIKVCTLVLVCLLFVSNFGASFAAVGDLTSSTGVSNTNTTGSASSTGSATTGSTTPKPTNPPIVTPAPTNKPNATVTVAPTNRPTNPPATQAPTVAPTQDPTAAPTPAPPTLTVTVTVVIQMTGDPSTVNETALKAGFAESSGIDLSQIEMRIIIINDTKRAQKFKVEFVAKQTVLLSEANSTAATAALANFNATTLTEKVEAALKDENSPLAQTLTTFDVEETVSAQATTEVYTPTLAPTQKPTTKPTVAPTAAPTVAASTTARSAGVTLQIPLFVMGAVASFVLLM